MSDYQYSLVLTITYIPYIIVEVPASLVLKPVGANILLPTMDILWGLTATLKVTEYLPGHACCDFSSGYSRVGCYQGSCLS